MDYKEGTVKKYKRQYTRTLKDGSKKQYTTEQSQVTLSKPHDVFENGENVLVLKDSHRAELDEFNKVMDDLKTAKISNISSENVESEDSNNNINSNISNKNSAVNDNEDDNDVYDTIVALEIYNYLLSSDNKEIRQELEETINRNAELSVKIRDMKKIIDSKNSDSKNNNGKNRNNNYKNHSISNNGTGNATNNSTNTTKSTSKSIEKLDNPIKDYKISGNNSNSEFNNTNSTNTSNNTTTTINTSYSKSNINPILDIGIKELEALDFDEIIDKFTSRNTINNTRKNLQAEIFKYKEEKLRKEYEYVYNAAKNEISCMQKHVRSFESQQNEKYNKLKAEYKNAALKRDLIVKELEAAKSKVSYLENINRKLKNYILR